MIFESFQEPFSVPYFEIQQDFFITCWKTPRPQKTHFSSILLVVLHYLLEKQNRNNLACLKPQHTYKTYKKWAKGIPHPSISPTSKPGIVSPCHRWPYEPSIYNNADVVDHLMVVLVMLFCGLQRLLNDPQHISDRLMMHLPYWKQKVGGKSGFTFIPYLKSRL